MSLVNYQFSYAGVLTPQALTPTALKMQDGIAAAAGYVMPRSCYLVSMTFIWSAASIGTDGGIVLWLTRNSDREIDTQILPADVVTGYKLATSSINFAFDAGDTLGFVALCFGTGETITNLVVNVELSTASLSGTDDAVLENISVATADLQTIKPNILDYLKDGESNFTTAILNQKRELYAEIKMHERSNYPGYTNAELDVLLAKITDYPLECNLANRLKHMVVGWILMDNRLYEEGDYYIQHAKAIPMQYFIDVDADAAAGDSEKSETQYPRFGR